MSTSTTENNTVGESFQNRLSNSVASNLQKTKGLFPSSNLPRNIFTNERYTAANLLYLAALGRPENKWATYKQIRLAGGKLLPGEDEKGAKIQYWQNYETVNGERKRLEKPRLIMLTVYNVGQTTGLNSPQQTLNTDAAEKFIQSANIVEVTRLSFGRYDRDRDQIQMPSPKMYPNRAQYLRGVVETMVERADAHQNPNAEYKNGTQEHAANQMKIAIASAIVCDELGIGANSGYDRTLSPRWSAQVKNHPVDVMKIATAAESLAQFTLSMEIESPEQDRARTYPDDYQEPNIAEHRVNLNVPFDERKMAQELGAEYDSANTIWYAPTGADLNALAPWMTGRELGKTNFMDPRDEFAARMKDLGLIVDGDHPIADGQKHRCKAVDDKPNQISGFYVFHNENDGNNIPAGHIYNNRTRQGVNWSSRSYHSLTPEQTQELRARAAEKRAEREVAITKSQEMVAEGLPERLQKWKPATTIEPGSYMDRKQIPPDENIRRTYNAVVVPGHDVNGKVWTLNIILDKDGTKLYASNSRKEGMMHVLGGIGELDKAKAFFVAEGYSTAATAKKALETAAPGNDKANPGNVAFIAAFDNGNIKPVVQSLRQKYPDKAIVIGGDDDIHLQFNDGRQKALEAAKEVSGRAVFPRFAASDKAAENKLSDFNDMAVKSKLGLEGVRRILEPAIERAIVERDAQSADLGRSRVKKEKSRKSTNDINR